MSGAALVFNLSERRLVPWNFQRVVAFYREGQWNSRHQGASRRITKIALSGGRPRVGSWAPEFVPHGLEGRLPRRPPRPSTTLIS